MTLSHLGTKLNRRDTVVSVSSTGAALREDGAALASFVTNATELVKDVIGISKEPTVDRVIVSVHLVRGKRKAKRTGKSKRRNP